MAKSTFSSTYLLLSFCLVLLLIMWPGNPFLSSRIHQATERDSLKNRFDALHRLWPGERMYVSTDKPLYNKGETIWLSVFLAEESRLTQPALSEIVYVEWINPKGSIEKKLNLIARGGKGNGDIQLAIDQVGGLYKIKAYTRWSEAQNQFFTKDIQVQETIIPNLKMNMELNRQAYAPGDQLEARLEVIQLNNKPLANASLEISVLSGGKNLVQQQAKTDAAGRYTVQFPIPSIVRGETPVLSISVDGNGISEMITKTIPMVDTELLVYFFPEGGDFVANQHSKIAIKVLKPDSTSADAEGWLVNQNGDKIQYIKTLHRGMGLIEFTPKTGDTYKVEWKSPIKTENVLPEPLERGFTLSLSGKTDSSCQFQISSPLVEPAILVAQMRGKWLWDKSITLPEGKTLVEVRTKSWPAGVAQFTLFDSRKVARNERLVFINPDRRLQFKIKTDKEKYQAREKVNLSVRAVDDRGLPVGASVTVAVVNDALLSYADDKQGNLASSLLLEQDLRTKLEDPTFYFGESPKAKPALDLVMMTYGWRGFSWKKILDGQIEPPSIKPQLARIAGKIMDEGSSKPLANCKLTIGETSITSDVDGNFRFPFVDLSKYAAIKIEKERMPAIEQPLTEYNENLVLHYWPHQPIRRFDNVPMAAMEMADNREVEVVRLKKGLAKEKALKNAVPPIAPRIEKQGQKNEDQKIAPIQNAKRIVRPGFPGGGAPMPNPEPLNVEPVYHRVRVFPNLPPAKSNLRNDFKTTIFWSGLVDLDPNGRGNFSFFTGDDITSYRATIQGIGSDGLVGASESLFFTELPISVSAKLPIELSIGDACKIPLLITNKSDKTKTLSLNSKIGKELKIKVNLPQSITLQPKETKEVLLGVSAVNTADSIPISLSIKAGVEEDEWSKTLRIVPRGYPIEASFSGREMEKSFLYNIKNLIPGSLNVHATAYPDVTSDLLAGVESILAEPFGCFEQTSMTSYPNVLALNYLRTLQKPDKALVSKAEVLLEKGYKRLVGFETKEKGYEWFGGTPAHEALTAYGLLQFKEMEKIAGYVDKGMMDRTAKWLLSRRDGKGGFLKSAQALDNFGRASDEITNAYIVYSLAEAGFQQLDQEIDKVVESALSKKDPYLLALAANTLWLMKKNEKAKELTKILIGLQKENGSWEGLTHSITYSQGEALTVETTSFSILALVRSEIPEKPKIDKAVQFLCSQRKGRGGFGNSQATIVALKALTAYVVFAKRTNEDGSFSLTVNGKAAAKASWKAGEQKAISRTDWKTTLQEGENRLEFAYSQLKDPLPFTLGINYFTLLPPSDPNTGLGLTTSISTSKIQLGKPVQLNISLRNEKNEGRPMVVAIVNIPGGCVVSPIQFKELMASKKIDFYEINGNRIYLYYRQMAPQEIKTVALTLSPVLRGTFQGSASSAYLYYTAERKQWSKPIDLTIN